MTTLSDNRSGEVGERMFEGFWRHQGVPVVGDNKSFHEPQIFPRDERVLIKQPLLQFEHRERRVDYLYKDFLRDVSIVWELRSQYRSGSTDEKLISAVADLERSPYMENMMVLVGNGFRAWVLRDAMRTARECSSNRRRIRVLHSVGDVVPRHISHLVMTGELLV